MNTPTDLQRRIARWKPERWTQADISILLATAPFEDELKNLQRYIRGPRTCERYDRLDAWEKSMLKELEHRIGKSL